MYKYVDGVSQGNKWITAAGKVSSGSIDVTDDYTHMQFRIRFKNGKTYDETFNVMVFDSKVSTNGEYEPYIEPVTTNIYLNEPLRKLEDVEDYIDFENQRVVRYIEEVDGVLTLLEEPKVEKIELPKLITFEGKTNVLSVDTTIEPSKIEAN